MSFLSNREIPSFARGNGHAKEAAKAALGWFEEKHDIHTLFGKFEISNIASQKMFEYCGFQLVDERNLLIQMIDKQHDFKYYRYYLHSS